METFIDNLAEIFEVEPNEITPNSKFREDIDCEWNSMMGFAIIVMIEEEYDVVITVPEFMTCITVQDLYDKAVGGTK